MKPEESEHLLNLIEDKIWSEVYLMGLQLMREEDPLKDALLYLTFVFASKEYIDCYDDMVQYACDKAWEQGFTIGEIRKLLNGFY